MTLYKHINMNNIIDMFASVIIAIKKQIEKKGSDKFAEQMCFSSLVKNYK